MTPDKNNKLILDHSESFVRLQDAEAVRKQLAPDFRDHDGPCCITLSPIYGSRLTEDRVAVRAAGVGPTEGFCQ